MKWPKLDYTNSKRTYETLHRWAQIVGKIKMVNSPWTNHSWHTALEVTPTGLNTGSFYANGNTASIELDFSSHKLIFTTSDGLRLSEPLCSEPVADFYFKVEKALNYIGAEAHFDMRPSEIDEQTTYDKDQSHHTYCPEHASDFWKALNSIDMVFKEFRADFLGKSSPSHFYWGSFDLALTRFSGRKAPEHPAGFPNIPDLVVKEAYSHELASFGFFPGNEMYPKPAFYSYAYPEPDGFSKARIVPSDAFYHEHMGEYLLDYEIVRSSADARNTLLDFLYSSYEAASCLGNWDKEELESDPFLRELRQERPIQSLR